MRRSIKQRKEKGFTLIELVVVLAVLAIIMAIAVPMFSGVREQAKVDSDMATMASIAKLAEFEYVRQNLDLEEGDNRVLKSPDEEALIENNFSKEGFFQSKNLNKSTSGDVKIKFNNNGKVETIKVNLMDYTCKNGRFSESTDVDPGNGD